MSVINRAIADKLSFVAPLFAPVRSMHQSIGFPLDGPWKVFFIYNIGLGTLSYTYKTPSMFYRSDGTPVPSRIPELWGTTVDPDAMYFNMSLLVFLFSWGAANYAT